MKSRSLAKAFSSFHCFNGEIEGSDSSVLSLLSECIFNIIHLGHPYTEVAS